MRIVRRVGSILVVFSALISGVALADVNVPTGASFNLNGGTLDLANTSLQVGGAFGLGSGIVTNAINIAIGAGAGLDGGTGTITLSGDWSDLGSFVAGGSHVNFVDGALALANITGNTTFANLSLISTIGKAYVLQVGSTQTISTALTILGTAGAGIQIKSATPGQAAFINLLTGGSQNIDFVGVSNVHATGQHLAPTKTNDGGSGDAVGWFGSVVGAIATTPAPILSTFAMVLMALVLLLTGWRRRNSGAF